ncbi:MAG: phenylalanine--tRNA ligase subunit alpha [Planctomycetes bacterium]|nr:phenylalanine--tRNA ligase subunit alpha [Planctomycetota bacterium]
MALSQFLDALNALESSAVRAFGAAADEPALESARVEFLGAKSGQLKSVQKGLGALASADKPLAGKRFHEVKAAIEGAFQSAKDRLASLADEEASTDDGGPLDPTLPGTPFTLGRLHPITQTIEELTEIMGRLGFSLADGPEIEDEWHNFEALNIPFDHPARDPLDNFYVAAATLGEKPLLLRSQTSTVQIRVMEAAKPPIRVISLGRVYRPDEVDATHYPMFHQVEGLWVDRRVTMADLKSTLRLFATSYLGRDVHIRFRPSFFPFTEPSVEVDFQWGDGWVEFGGAGMVDPAVLTAVGYDAEEVTGFAFGLGIERLCMRRHQITDIRELFRNDVRFLRQF